MEQQKFTLQYCIPPAPYTERGLASFLDVQGSYIIYFNGPTLVVRSLDDFDHVKTYQHKSNVNAAKLSYDGKLVASIDQKGTLIIHQIGPKQFIEVNRYQNFFIGAKCIDFTADRKKICVVGESTKTFGRVISIDTGTNVGQITGVSSNLSACCFRSVKQNKLVVGGNQFNIKLYQGPPYKFVKSIKAHTNFINQIKYSPTGSHFISVSSDKKIIIYDGEKIQIIRQKIDAHNGSIFGVDWLDQNHFVTVSADKTIKIWNTQLEQKKVILSCSQQDIKNIKKIQYFQVAVKCHKGKIYSLSLNGNITVYNNPLLQNYLQKTKVMIGIQNKPIKIFKLDPNFFVVIDTYGKILMINSEDYSVKQCFESVLGKIIIDGFWNRRTQNLTVLWGDNSVTSYKWSSKDSSFSLNFSIKQSNAKLICQSEKFQFIGVSNSHLSCFQKQQEVNKVNVEEDPSYLTEYQNATLSIIIVGSMKGNVWAYNSNTLQLIGKAKTGATKISSLHFIQCKLPTFVCGDSLGHLKVWRFNQQNKLQQVSGSIGSHGSVVTSIKSVGDQLYTSGMDNRIYVWKVDETGTKYQRLYQQTNVHNFGVYDLQLLNEKRIITCGGDLLIKSWKV